MNDYGLRNMEGVVQYEELRHMYYGSAIKNPRSTYNPQMSKGKPYKSVSRGSGSIIYTSKKRVGTSNKGTRYPRSVIKIPTCKSGLHPTQKPVALCEWLIKTYSNPNELVLDFCMGSGSTGVACLRTGRRFIGIEKDNDMFAVARKRLHLTAIRHGAKLKPVRMPDEEKKE
jgi:DNA modification methylase